VKHHLATLSPGCTVATFAQIVSPDDLHTFEELRDRTPWQQRFFGAIPVPRLTAWVADPGCSYTYSRQKHDPLPWTPMLIELRERVERACATAVGKAVAFNSVLLNRYRGGADSVAWHADDERELGEDPTIASLTLGAPRDFLLKPRGGRARDVVKYTLGHGDLLVMFGRCQRDWLHSVPKAKDTVGERINLTFRTLLPGLS
jgi:alkylated DNA repair dioxygenase AlkB